MIKPLNDFIVIKSDDIEETSNSGILLLESAQQKPQTGVIVSVGEGRIMENGKRIPLSVYEGDKVIYSRYAGTQITYEGQTYLLVREMDILAVIESV